jgi:hypothetical protein
VGSRSLALNCDSLLINSRAVASPCPLNMAVFPLGLSLSRSLSVFSLNVIWLHREDTDMVEVVGWIGCLV